LTKLLLAAVILAAAGGAAWARWERRRQDPWVRLLGRVRRRLERAGLQPGEAATPRELARMLAQRHDPADNRVQAIAAWLQRFERHRYAPQGSAGATDLATLRREMKQLSWPT
jgi:hypothetical protein